MPAVGETCYWFEGYTLDLGRGCLRHGDHAIELRPKSFAVLRHLVENAGRLIAKDELIKSVWPDVIVSDGSVTRCISDVRQALRDFDQRLIKTVSRRGYVFEAPVSASAMRRAPTASPTVEAKPSVPPPLSIVVLPFVNLGGDPEQEYFVDGVTESLTTDLAALRGTVVIGRHTAFTYKGTPVDVREVGRALNVRYVLEGSIQRSGTRMRVNVQLIDAGNGHHLWADRFDKTIADLFDMQDEIVTRLCNALYVPLINAEARRAERAPHPDSTDLYFRGLASFNKGRSPENLEQARNFFERALALDPGNIDAMVGTSAVDLTSAAGLLADDAAARLAAAEATAIKVLSLAPNHAAAQYVLGYVHILTNRTTEGLAACERALALDRNLADAHAAIGLAKYMNGRSEEIEAHVLEALRLSPRDILAFAWMALAGTAKLAQSRDEEAVAWLRRSIEANRNFPAGHFLLGAALANLGRLDEARAASRAGLALDPTFTIRRVGAASGHPRFLAQLERVRDGMRKAGAPER